MAVSITHTTVAVGGSDPTKEINAPEWNAAHSLAGLGTGVETALGLNVGDAGAVVVNGGALGTPSSGSAANLTGMPTAGLADGAVSYVKTTGIFSRVISDRQLANDANPNAYLEAAADTLTVAAATAYEFETLIEIEGQGATTRTTAFLFGGNATITSCFYHSMIFAGNANATATAQTTKFSNAATAQVLAGTNAAAATTIWIRGFISINGAGTLIPQIQFSADPTGTILSKAGTFFKATPVGSNVAVSQGAWA